MVGVDVDGFDLVSGERNERLFGPRIFCFLRPLHPSPARGNGTTPVAHRFPATEMALDAGAGGTACAVFSHGGAAAATG